MTVRYEILISKYVQFTVVTYTVQTLISTFRTNAFMFRIKYSKKCGLLRPEHEGITFLQNVGNYYQPHKP